MTVGVEVGVHPVYNKTRDCRCIYFPCGLNRTLVRDIWRVMRMARLTARGKDLFTVQTNKRVGGEVITRIATELRLKDNGNLLKRVRTFFKPGFLGTGKNFISTGWVLEAKGIPLSPEQLLKTLEQAGFKKMEKE
jgi:hypothetical protein